MRKLLLALVLAQSSLGCSLLLPVAAVATYPMDKKATFEGIQARYTANIRYGLYEEALPFVEPAVQPRFREQIARYRELRFSDYRIEGIEIDAPRMRATATVSYRGYWLSSPFEQELRVVQHWRREAPTQNWYVTPEFDKLLEAPRG